MKSFATVFGFIIGSLIGLSVGNSWTAVMLGTVGAFASVWIWALDWAKFATTAKELAGKMDLTGAGTSVKNACITVKSATLIILETIWLVLFAKELRRYLLAALFVFGLAATFLVLSLVPPLGGIELGAFASAFAFWAVFLWMISSVVGGVYGLLVFIITCIIANEIRTGEQIEENINENHSFGICFWLGWHDQFINSEKSTTRAFFEMVGIRFWNALKILGYCFFALPLWALLSLANTKTRLSAASAGTLCFAHLGASMLWFGGIDAWNVNFWSSFVLTGIAGYFIGGKISEKSFDEAGTKKRPFPTIEFAVQK